MTTAEVIAAAQALKARASMPNPLNSRRADLVLLSKNHYPSDSRVEGARRVVAFHNLHRFGSIRDEDVAHCVLHDLMFMVLPTMDSSRVAAMILSLGDRSVVGGYVEREGGVYQGMIQMILEAAAHIQIKEEDGTPIHVIPAPDPVLKQLVAAEDPNEALVLIGLGAA